MAKRKKRVVKKGPSEVWADESMELTDGQRVLVSRHGVIREETLERRTPVAAAAFMPGGIERQEKEAQARLVSTQQVPIKLGSPKELFEKLGFKFGRTVDKMLQEAELPTGWTKVPHPSHSMYSYVLDPQGRARWMIFFKGAFYDYEAFGYGLQHRYVAQTETDYDSKARAGEKPERGIVLDFGVKFDPDDRTHGGVKPKVVHSSQEGWFTPKNVWHVDDLRKMLLLEMELWIDSRFPNHQDPLAHWEE